VPYSFTVDVWSVGKLLLELLLCHMKEMQGDAAHSCLAQYSAVRFKYSAADNAQARKENAMATQHMNEALTILFEKFLGDSDHLKALVPVDIADSGLLPDFLLKCLKVHGDSRFKVPQLLEHPWIEREQCDQDEKRGMLVVDHAAYAKMFARQSQFLPQLAATASSQRAASPGGPAAAAAAAAPSLRDFGRLFAARRETLFPRRDRDTPPVPSPPLVAAAAAATGARIPPPAATPLRTSSSASMRDDSEGGGENWGGAAESRRYNLRKRPRQ